MKNEVKKIFEDLFINYPVLVQCKEDIAETFFLLVTCYGNEGKVLTCGNGGSAADSEHMVAELMKGFLKKRQISDDDREKICEVDSKVGKFIANGLQRALPAISLVSQVSLLSAFSNDVDADLVYAQQVYGYGKQGDVLMAFSTSGNSSNVCRAALVGKALGLYVVGLSGNGRGKLSDYCDVTISVPSDLTFRIQEYHLPIYHSLCAMLEEEFYGE